MASLTKEELKNALISHGAPVPPASAKKDEFIQAYEEHVAPLDAGGEFSSDEEGPKTPSKRVSNVSKGKPSTSSRKSQGSPRKTPSKALEDSVDIEMNIDIGSLDDDQLFEMLKKNGVEVGPIVASTRKFYEKKLTAALAGETAPASNGTNGTKEFSDTEPEDEEEEEEEQPAVVEVAAKRRTPRSGKSSSSSGLRQRLALADELDSSPASPGARRAIHSYKVTETTRQVTTRSKDGTETVDTKHSVERSESQGVSPTGSRSIFSRLAYPLLKLAIFLTLLIGVYIVFTTPSDGVTPIDKVADIINNAMPPAEEIKAEVPEVMKKAVEEAAAAPPPPSAPAPPASDASNVVDV
jgi:hypothetical protein